MARFYFVALILCLPYTFPAWAASPLDTAESVVVSILLNTEPKGEFFLVVTPGGHYWMKLADLQAIGFQAPVDKSLEHAGERYLALQALPGVEVTIDESTLTVAIMSTPEHLPPRSIDLQSSVRQPTRPTQDTSLFLNYRLHYDGNTRGTQALHVTTEAGARLGAFLFHTENVYSTVPTDTPFLRLSSNVTYDDRATLQRWVGGDVVASSGALGGVLNLGGLSVSKIYRMNPYFIKQPLARLTGAVALPSEAEVLLDGIRVAKTQLAPGAFAFNNLNYYGGLHDVQITLKDRFGREQTLHYPYYFTDVLLQQGLHEYSYHLGWMRQEVGIASNHYGRPAFAALHHYGMSDNVTVGVRGEATTTQGNLGMLGLYRLGTSGVLSVDLSAGYDTTRPGVGLAGSLGYSYQWQGVNIQCLFRGLHPTYPILGRAPSAARPWLEAHSSIGYRLPALGSVTLAHAITKNDQGHDDRQTATLTYSRSLASKATLFATIRRVIDPAGSTEFFLGMAYYPTGNVAVHYLHQQDKDTSVETLQVSKNPPVGEGLGYRMIFEKTVAGGHADAVAPFLQYHTPYGILTGEVISRSLDGSTRREAIYQLSASGALSYVGGSFGLSRPIDDSFALVKVGELAGVRVYHANQEIGRTGAHGTLFVPNLSAYLDNQISINDQDIPLHYAISDVMQSVSPPLRSGAFVPFKVTRIQAITGRLQARVDRKDTPVASRAITLLVDGKPLTFPTSQSGEFYLENLQPGVYAASFHDAGETYTCMLTVPTSAEMILDLGEVRCATHH